MSHAIMSHAIQIIVAPTVEPVTLEQMRLHLKVDAEGSPLEHPDDDLITAQIQAAREYCEDYLGYAIVEQQLRLFLDVFPASDVIALPRSQLVTIDTVEYYDTDGVLQTWDDANYSADSASAEGRLLRAPDVDWPETQDRRQAVRITYTAGYASAGSPADYRANIPARIFAAIKLLVADMYESRQQLIIGAAMTNTKAAENLLHPLRRIRLT